MASVYLYIMDALRADHVNDELTPNIMALARDGVHFSNAFSQATWSLPSMVSLMTGLYPSAIGNFGDLPFGKGAREFGFPHGIVPISSLFKDQGFYTAAYSANVFFTPTYGMERGYDYMPQVYDLPELAQRAEISRQISKKLGRKRELLLPLITSKDLRDIWQSQPEHENEFNVFWVMDTHDPFYDRNKIDDMAIDDLYFIQKATEDLTKATSLYRDMVQYTDTQFGKFVEALKQRGKYNDSFIIVCSDHGESFGEHGAYGHTNMAYESEIHVPLVVKFPDGQYAGQSIGTLTGLIDIVPTLVDYFDLQPPYELHGKSLLKAINDDNGHDALFLYDQSFDQYWRYGMVRTRQNKFLFRERIPITRRRLWKRLRKRRLFNENKFRLIRDVLPLETKWVFDLEADPEEKHNLVKKSDWLTEAEGMFKAHKARCRAFFDQYVGYTPTVKQDDKVSQRLRDLGYLE